jgi:lysophospholipase L1-like esterase
MVHAAALLALVALVALSLVRAPADSAAAEPKAHAATVAVPKVDATTTVVRVAPVAVRGFPVITRPPSTTSTSTTTTTSTTTSPSTTSATAAAVPETDPPPPPSPEPVAGLVTFIGDSVLLGVHASGEIDAHFPRAHVDAVVSRQLGEADGAVRAHLATGTLGEVVVVALGTNGVGTSADVDAVMQAVAGTAVRRVVFVNIRAPRPWEGSMNQSIAEGTARSGAGLADWYSVASANPGYLVDGVHTTAAGSAAWAALVAAAVG